jgi:hypothetical protein
MNLSHLSFRMWMDRFSRPATAPRSVSPLRQWLADAGRPQLVALEDRAVPAILTVTTAVDEADDSALSTGLSLREALLIANDSTGATTFKDGAAGTGTAVSSTNAADTIVFSDAVFNAPAANTIALALGQLPVVTQAVTVDGSIDAAAARVRINGGGTSRLFQIQATTTLTNLDLLNGAAGAGQDGGAVLVAGATDATLTKVLVQLGTAANGGGVAAGSGKLTLTNAKFADNTAAVAGGGLYVAGNATVVATDSSFQNNTAGVNGGGLHVSGAGTVTVRRGTVAGNTAQQEGGGLWNSAAGTLTIDGTQVTGNTANGAADPVGNNANLQGGGGVFNDGGTLRVTSVAGVAMISGNTALGSGGGIMSVGGTLQATGVTVDGNEAVRAGGGIEVVSGTASLTGVTVTNNDVSVAGRVAAVAPGNGGGLHVTAAATVSVYFGTFTTNAAGADGGGLWNSATGTLNLFGTQVSRNTAAGNGGGVYNNGGVVSAAGLNLAGPPTGSGSTLAPGAVATTFPRRPGPATAAAASSTPARSRSRPPT